MGISKLFGLKIKGKGKDKDTKVKKSSQVSLEVNSLRGRIDSEYRENFPNLARYKDLYRDAQAVYRILDAMIVNKDHADDAIRMRDDLRKKLDALGAKIKRNVK
jgi:hypothetical protein